MERRTFLAAGGASVLAFSTTLTAVTSETTAGTPTDVVAEYYRQANMADSVRDFATRIPELAHSTSPLSMVADDVPNAFDDPLDQELIARQVVGEDVDTERVEGFSDFFAGSLSESDVETLAGNNAVVTTILDWRGANGAPVRISREWLVAPENGEWRLVWFDGRNDPLAAAEGFFSRVNAADGISTLDESIAEFTHSASPLVNASNYTPWLFRGLRRQELLGTEIIAADIARDEIASDFSPVVGWASENELDTIVEDNTVVAVRLRDEQAGIDAFTQSWLLAPEYDKWQVVWL